MQVSELCLPEPTISFTTVELKDGNRETGDSTTTTKHRDLNYCQPSCPPPHNSHLERSKRQTDDAPNLPCQVPVGGSWQHLKSPSFSSEQLDRNGHSYLSCCVDSVTTDTSPSFLEQDDTPPRMAVDLETERCPSAEWQTNELGLHPDAIMPTRILDNPEVRNAFDWKSYRDRFRYREAINSPHTALPQKRPKSEDGDDEDSHYEDSSDKRARTTKQTTQPLVYEFACPYYKRNRQRYCHQRSCRTSSWPSVHRVKEHLYRHHMHYVCERCSSTFKQPALLREHLRQDEACNVSPWAVAEDAGFGQELEKKLRSRKKIDGQTECDKWTHMFRMLFPSFKDKRTPSPYVDYSLQEEPSSGCSLRDGDEATSEKAAPLSSAGGGMTTVALASSGEQQILTVGKTDDYGTLAPEKERRGFRQTASPASVTTEMIAEAELLAPNLSKRLILRMFQKQLQEVLAGMPSSPASSGHDEG